MNWLSWQIDYLLLLQNFRDFSNHIFDSFFLQISNFGLTDITFILLFAIYWCYNKKIGIFMINCYALSYLMNIFLKLTFCIYRPWILDERIKPLEQAFKTAPGYSFPSGHTAGATSCWGSFCASFWNNKIIRYTCIAIIFLVMLSRNYLGVHTPQDIIVSLAVGIAIIFGCKKLFDWIDKKDDNFGYYIIAVAVACILLGIYITIKTYPVDYVNGKLLYDPTGVGTGEIPRIINLFAIMFGCYLESKFVKFSPEKGGIIEKIIRLSIGLSIGYFLIEGYLRAFLNTGLDYTLAKGITYAISGFFLTFIYPLFIKLFEVASEKLSKKTEV